MFATPRTLLSFAALCLALLLSWSAPHFRSGGSSLAPTLPFQTARTTVDASNSLGTPSTVDEARPAAATFEVKIEPVFSEAVTLSQHMERHGVSLDPAMTQILAETIVAFQQVRRDYEAKISRVIDVAQDRVDIFVPSYSEVGDAMRSVFYAELQQRAGSPSAARIQAELGEVIEEELGGFGRPAQLLEFSCDPNEGPALLASSIQSETKLNGAGRYSSPRLTYLGADFADADCLSAFLPQIKAAFKL